MTTLEIGGHTFNAWTIPTAHVSILIIAAPKGMLCCGYISMDAAEKFGDPAVMVTGVKNFEDMLNATVVKISSAAAALGVSSGMTGKEALLRMV